MRKTRKLKNWMGEDWTVKRVEKFEQEGYTAICDFNKKEIRFKGTDPNTEITCVMHEAVHRATGLGSEDDAEELRVEYATLCLKEFMEKMGVDLTPLRG